MSDASRKAHEDLVSVYTAADEMEARMVQEVLARAGIESAINAEVTPGLFPAKVGDIAQQDILVLESAADEARRIIAELPGPAPIPPEDSTQG